MDPERTDSDEVAAAKRIAWSVALATSAYGVGFGALAVAAGLNVWQTCVLSAVMFTGGSQFAFIGVVAGGGLGALPAAVASASLLGARNVAYAIRMKPVVGGRWPLTLAAAQVTIDESVAVSLAQRSPRARKTGFWLTGIGVFLGWNLTTLIGALIGDVLGGTDRYGLDAAAAAAFLGLLWPRLRERQAIAVGVAAAVIATCLTPVMTPGLPVLVAAVVAIIVGWWNWFGTSGMPGRTGGLPSSGGADGSPGSGVLPSWPDPEARP
ncbi:AzlC family ABC transporter permease [Rarobacter faecitabidus]|uniref:Putative branched-subunit amino acid permease n=1 Tax=Rarobacter faecitabidus TaxID=13243 RepID=A0A542ZV68_RARFA|nr:AzlC family ABC transporter permease [Rarobacter faecitabidus]TQL64254.1 putative branched-subunit amino acid permease [Rarobacter faecitabidus]